MLCPTKYVFNHSNPHIWNAVLTSFLKQFGNSLSFESSTHLTGLVMFLMEDEQVKYRKARLLLTIDHTHMIMMSNRANIWWYDVVDRLVMMDWFEFLAEHVRFRRRLCARLNMLSRACDVRDNHLIVVTNTYIQIETMRMPIIISNSAFANLIDRLF